MKAIFLAEAEQELIQAVEYYDYLFQGLGAVFQKEVFGSVELIRRYPQGYPLITSKTRKCPLRKFPYLILYGIVNDVIVITAVAHQHRHPRSYTLRN